MFLQILHMTSMLVEEEFHWQKAKEEKENVILEVLAL
jgi:hypothetical protein